MTVNNGVAAQSPVATGGEVQPYRQNFEPRVKLRDEAPRPLDLESRAAATVYTSPAIPVSTGDNTPVAASRSAAADWRASGLSPAEFVSNSAGAATINASYSQPAEMATNTQTVGPPPWFEPAEESGPRTHLVVDGDSLERLAGRYLDDSSRGHEIYEANRELLASPDLLPIGAELVIPERRNRAAFEATSPQSSVAGDPGLRAATHGDLDRRRPIPAAASVLPRAQLMQPVRVD
jgi:nucleoid-associated protein YgaU